MSNKFLTVRVRHFEDGHYVKIETVYNKDYGWTEFKALKVEKEIMLQLGWDSYEIHLKPYEE